MNANIDILRLLTDINALWNREGFGSDDAVSDPLKRRLEHAIAAIDAASHRAGFIWPAQKLTPEEALAIVQANDAQRKKNRRSK